jgi:hypothetical protein
MSKDKDETIKKDYKDTDILKIQVLSENAHSSFTIAFSIVVGIVIELVSSYLSYYLTNQTYATYLSYLVSIFVLSLF